MDKRHANGSTNKFSYSRLFALLHSREYSHGPFAWSIRMKRRGQTAIEYLLVTVSLLFVFVTLYRTLQWYLSREFRAGGVIVMRMYKQTPN